MSGCTKGVQERFRRDVPQAVYTNCYAHRLHLVLVNCVKNIRSISEFFVTIHSLYNFFSSSVVHQKFQKEQNTESPHVEVKRLSDTNQVGMPTLSGQGQWSKVTRCPAGSPICDKSRVHGVVAACDENLVRSTPVRRSPALYLV